LLLLWLIDQQQLLNPAAQAMSKRRVIQMQRDAFDVQPDHLDESSAAAAEFQMHDKN
jgi:acyl dehydratase